MRFRPRRSEFNCRIRGCAGRSVAWASKTCRSSRTRWPINPWINGEFWTSGKTSGLAVAAQIPRRHPFRFSGVRGRLRLGQLFVECCHAPGVGGRVSRAAAKLVGLGAVSLSHRLRIQHFALELLDLRRKRLDDVLRLIDRRVDEAFPVVLRQRVGELGGELRVHRGKADRDEARFARGRDDEIVPDNGEDTVVVRLGGVRRANARHAQDARIKVHAATRTVEFGALGEFQACAPRSTTSPAPSAP